ncbi:MAG: hypothetical protein ACKVIX_01500 [Sphingomonadales bacterium]
MSKITKTLMLLFLVLLAAGTIALMTMSIPAPSETVERELPDDIFPR